jgi:hypothetical protein
MSLWEPRWDSRPIFRKGEHSGHGVPVPTGGAIYSIGHGRQGRPIPTVTSVAPTKYDFTGHRSVDNKDMARHVPTESQYIRLGIADKGDRSVAPTKYDFMDHTSAPTTRTWHAMSQQESCREEDFISLRWGWVLRQTRIRNRWGSAPCGPPD